MKKVFHIFLAFTVLASSLGFTVYERVCNLRGHEITFSSDLGKCCAGHAPKAVKAKRSCCKSKPKPATETVDAGRCCSHKAILLQAHAGAPVSVTKVQTDKPMLAHPVPVQHVVPMAIFAFQTFSLFDGHPVDPPNGQSLRVMYQSFLC